MSSPGSDGDTSTLLADFSKHFLSDLDAVIVQHHAELRQHLDDRMARSEKLLELLVGNGNTTSRTSQVPASQVPAHADVKLESPSLGRDQHPRRAPTLQSFLSASEYQTPHHRSPVSDVTHRFSNDSSFRRFETMGVLEARSRETHYRHSTWVWEPGRPGACGYLKSIITSLVSWTKFDYFIASIILINAATVGVEVEERGTDIGTAAVWVQYGCNVLFIVELLLRITAHGKSFFCGDEWPWNMMDTCLVIVSLTEMVAAGSQSSKFENVKMIRIVRIIRVVRIMRVIRLMRFFRPLRMLVHSIFATLKSLVYAVLLLLVIMYSFAVIFTQATLDHTGDRTADAGATQQILEDCFGSVMRSILTLFMCISGGMNWENAREPLESLHWSYTCLFIFYIVFSLFAVLNVMTGQFCQGAIESAKRDDEEVIAEQLAATNLYTAQLKKLFEQITKGSTTNYVTMQTFETYLADRHVQAYFRSLDIEPIDAWTIFKLLDEENANAVQLEQFITGCLKLRGVAKTIGLKELMYELRWFTKFAENRLRSIERGQAKLQAALATSGVNTTGTGDPEEGPASAGVSVMATGPAR